VSLRWRWCGEHAQRSAHVSDIDASDTLSVVNVPLAADLPAGVISNGRTHSFKLVPIAAAYPGLVAGATATSPFRYASKHRDWRAE